MISWTLAIFTIFGQIYHSRFVAEEGFSGQDF